MTQLKVIKEFEVIKRAEHVSFEEGEKLPISNTWSEIKDWFTDYNFVYMALEKRNDIINYDVFMTKVEARQFLDTLINGDQVFTTPSGAMHWDEGGTKAALMANSATNDIFNAVKASNRTFKSDWSFTHEGLAFFRKYFYFRNIKLKFSVGAIVDSGWLSKQLESRSVRMGEHVEETNSNPTDTSTPEEKIKKLEKEKKDLEDELKSLKDEWDKDFSDLFTGDKGLTVDNLKKLKEMYDKAKKAESNFEKCQQHTANLKKELINQGVSEEDIPPTPEYKSLIGVPPKGN